MNHSVTYFARALGEIQYAPGGWYWTCVGVFRREVVVETQIGEYERNYPSLFRTFATFRADGRDLALYSPDYTATRLLDLPSCRDIGGEEPNSGGFCPVEFFVPYFVDLDYRVGDAEPRRIRKQMPAAQELVERTIPITRAAANGRPVRVDCGHYVAVGGLTQHPFGFVAGCVWGDDSSWKLQYLDLSQAASGILRREERFGYVELPDGLRLENAVDL